MDTLFGKEKAFYLTELRFILFPYFKFYEYKYIKNNRLRL
jgi:hypothetical protein